MDTTLQNQPYHWLKQIPEDLWQMDESPLLGYAPPFPWSDVQTKIAESLGIGPVELQPGEWQWRSQEELFTGLGDKLTCITLNVPPLEGAIYWVMPEHETKLLAKQLLSQQVAVPPEQIDEAFITAVERLLTVEVINACEKAYFNGKLSPCILDSQSLPTEHSLCLDVSANLEHNSVHGRLLLSDPFRKAWKKHFETRPEDFIATSAMAEKLDTIVHLEAGKVHLSLAEWKNIHIGDLLLLDSCSLDPDEDKGRVMLVINGIPFFRAKIKQGSLKILEHPLYHEVDVDMTPPPTNHDDESELFDESSFEDDFNTEDFTDEDLSDATGDQSLASEGEAAESEHPEAPAGQPLEAELPAIKAETPAQIVTSLEDVPLSIVVEVGRLQMSIKKLLELQPGNMLDLNIHPEAGVDLVLNGKRVAKGELLRIGEALGVRITEMS